MIERYVPEFDMTHRGKAMALWVKMPNGRAYNIWDVPEVQLTHVVQQAIMSAFERGLIAGDQLQKQEYAITYGKTFSRRDEK